MKELLSVEVAIIIAKNLRNIRKKTGLTQEQVAKLANVHRVSYAKYETGKRIMDIQTLIKVAFALNVTVNEVLNGVLEKIQKEED